MVNSKSTYQKFTGSVGLITQPAKPVNDGNKSNTPVPLTKAQALKTESGKTNGK